MANHITWKTKDPPASQKKTNSILHSHSKSKMSNSALFRFYCEANPYASSTSSSSITASEVYDDSATTSTSTQSSSGTKENIVCQVTIRDKTVTPDVDDTPNPSCNSTGQLMELLFDIYCLLNGFLRSLLDSNSTIRGKCALKETCDDLAILDILQRIVDREILVDEKCRKYPALIPMLTAINRKFQSAEGLFSEVVDETRNSDLVDSLVESVQNIHNYFACMQVMNGTEKEVESDLQEILCYLDHPLQSDKTSGKK